MDLDYHIMISYLYYTTLSNNNQPSNCETSWKIYSNVDTGKAVESNETRILKYMCSTADSLPKGKNGYSLKMKNLVGSVVL